MQGNSWTPLLDKDGELIGPYPEMIDLLDSRVLNPPLSADQTLRIANDSSVRRLNLSCNVSDAAFLTINDLPALEELSIVGVPDAYLENFLWVYIGSVPSLRTVTINGRVRSLNIQNAGELRSLGVGACIDLYGLSLIGVHPKINIDVLGCLKLRQVHGITLDGPELNVLEGQINRNQESSRYNGVLYESMTFTDVDLVQNAINEGVKALSRSGILKDDRSLLGYYGDKADDADFKPYSYRLLEPLESVYTGGTGETYSFAVVDSDVSREDQEVTEEDYIGVGSPEEALGYMLHITRQRLMEHDRIYRNTSDEELLDILKQAAVK